MQHVRRRGKLAGTPRRPGDSWVSKYRLRYPSLVSPHNQIVDIVLAAAAELNATLEAKIALNLGELAPLYGDTGVLDSLGLVSLVIAVEEGVQRELGAVVTLADERAVSQHASPFRSVGTLVRYVEAQLAESRA